MAESRMQKAEDRMQKAGYTRDEGRKTMENKLNSDLYQRNHPFTFSLKDSK